MHSEVLHRIHCRITVSQTRMARCRGKIFVDGTMCETPSPVSITLSVVRPEMYRTLWVVIEKLISSSSSVIHVPTDPFENGRATWAPSATAVKEYSGSVRIFVKCSARSRLAKQRGEAKCDLLRRAFCNRHVLFDVWTSRTQAHKARPASCKAGLVSGWPVPDLRHGVNEGHELISATIPEKLSI